MSLVDAAKSGARSGIRRLLPLLPRGKSRLLSIVSPWLTPYTGVETRRIGGYRIRLDHRIRATRLMAYDVYEAAELRFLRKLLRPGDVVFDVGANVGYMAVHFARCVGPRGEVYAFEPSPTCVTALEGMLEPAAPGVIRFVPGAVGRMTGKTTYYETERILSHGFGRIGNRPSERHEVMQEVEVPLYRLDEFCLQNSVRPPAFVKIDVEGAEADVVEGMSGLFDKGIRPGMLTEVSTEDSPPPEMVTLRNRLSAVGYRGYRLAGSHLQECDPLQLPPRVQCNVFWFCTPPGSNRFPS
jgi:FkbM family methyltransferase